MCLGIFKKQATKPKQPEPYGTLSIHEMSSILLDKLEELDDVSCELYLPDQNCKVYKKQDVVDFLELDGTNKITYISETMDCDDFAAELFGKFLGLLWTNKHGFNWFIDENSKLWFIEPQTDKIADFIESWQGVEVRFFLGR